MKGFMLRLFALCGLSLAAPAFAQMPGYQPYSYYATPYGVMPVAWAAPRYVQVPVLPVRCYGPLSYHYNVLPPLPREDDLVAEPQPAPESNSKKTSRKRP